jgi:hypothetical protein
MKTIRTSLEVVGYTASDIPSVILLAVIAVVVILVGANGYPVSWLSWSLWGYSRFEPRRELFQSAIATIN